MKKTCGYKSKNGTIFESKKKCVEADYSFDMKAIDNKMDTLERLILERMHRADTFDYDKVNNVSYRTYIVEGLKTDIAKYIANNIDHMIMVSKKQKVLHKEYAKLYKKAHRPWWYIK